MIEVCRSHRWIIEHLGDLDKTTLMYAKSLEFSLTKKTGRIIFYTTPEVLEDIQKVIAWENKDELDLIFKTTNSMFHKLNTIAFSIYDINHYLKLDYASIDILYQTLTFKIKYVTSS